MPPFVAFAGVLGGLAVIRWAYKTALRVNQELEQYLHIFMSEQQDDWDELLPLGEFQYNNHVHSSSQHTPFLLDTGQHPHMGFEPRMPTSKLETVNEFTARMKNTLEKACSALSKAKAEHRAALLDFSAAPA